ncbi:MAG TPA: hypothetical protein VHL59_05965 [Thermoanaerobaculia bacterium]|nr:hypothetical protein [Thermoanaerobaculia bacterium]
MTVGIEHLIELLLQPIGSYRIRDAAALERFRTLSSRYADVCNRMLGALDASDPQAPGYDWTGWAASVRRAFRQRVPNDFLGVPVLRHTMVYSRRRGIENTKYRIRLVREAFGEEVTRRLLREDPIGQPIITTLRYLTSANGAHHAMHLAEYRKATGESFWDSGSFVEWGGGYGNMARLVRRMNGRATFTIIDLPELSALQYVYLGALEGETQVHIVDPARPEIRPGKINLVSVHDVGALPLRADAFVSTWALTESPRDAQNDVAQSDFFGARRVLLASARNENNALYDAVDSLRVRRVPIPEAARIGAGNEYWFRS